MLSVGLKWQGRGDAAKLLFEDAKRVEAAGAFAVVLEAVPSSLASDITAALDIPTIGIGAGIDCDGQVLVLHDMLGIYPKKSPKFSKNYMQGADSVFAAVSNFVADV